MLPAFLVVAAIAFASDPADRTYNGRAGRLDVSPPRVQAEIVVDGRLDEPVWSEAARLTGFSLYAPVDGRPASDSTEVLVWYSAKAMHFGIRAYAEAGTVRASLGDRDKSYSDDYIGIFLATVGGGRQATVFAVNPLGVQGDGIVVEGARSSGGGLAARRLVVSRRTSARITSFNRRVTSPTSVTRSKSRFHSRACSSATPRVRRGG